mgnify:CR=1 FL=1
MKEKVKRKDFVDGVTGDMAWALATRAAAADEFLLVSELVQVRSIIVLRPAAGRSGHGMLQAFASGASEEIFEIPALDSLRILLCHFGRPPRTYVTATRS